MTLLIVSMSAPPMPTQVTTPPAPPKAEFDGLSGYIEIPEITLIGSLDDFASPTHKGHFSIEWDMSFDSSATSDRYVFSGRDSELYIRPRHPQTPAFWFGDPSGGTTIGSYPGTPDLPIDDAEHHYKLYSNGVSIHMDMDGVLLEDTEVPFELYWKIRYFGVNYYQDRDQLQGTMSNLVIRRNDNILVASYAMDEDYSVTSVVTDSGPNGYHGTAYNMTSTG